MTGTLAGNLYDYGNGTIADPTVSLDENANVINPNTSGWPVVITKSDATDLTAQGFRAIFIGGGGEISVIGVNDTSAAGAGTAVVFTVPNGFVLQVRPRKVMSTGTTATNIIGLK